MTINCVGSLLGKALGAHYDRSLGQAHPDRAGAAEPAVALNRGQRDLSAIERSRPAPHRDPIARYLGGTDDLLARWARRACRKDCVVGAKPGNYWRGAAGVLRAAVAHMRFGPSW